MDINSRTRDLRLKEWRYRAISSVNTARILGWSTYFVTLTYDEKHLENHTNRKLVSEWIIRLRKKIAVENAYRRIAHEKMLHEHVPGDPLYPAPPKLPERHPLFDSMLDYMAVKEYGTENGRPHYHLLLSFSHAKWTRHDFPKWTQGNIDIRWTDGSPKVGSYIAKYATKSIENQERISCNFTFGLTTAIILLSMPSYRTFLLTTPTALRLLAQLSQTFNYPTYQRMTSCSLWRKAWTSCSSQRSTTDRQRTGAKLSGKAEALNGTPCLHAARESSEYHQTLAIATLAEAWRLPPGLRRFIPGLPAFTRYREAPRVPEIHRPARNSQTAYQLGEDKIAALQQALKRKAAWKDISAKYAKTDMG